MENKNINNVLNEIINSDNIAIRILRDTVGDYRKLCKKLIITNIIFGILCVMLGVNFIFSIL